MRWHAGVRLRVRRQLQALANVGAPLLASLASKDLREADLSSWLADEESSQAAIRPRRALVVGPPHPCPYPIGGP